MRSIVPAAGTTTERNALSGQAVGMRFYDETLDQMFVWNGSAWVGAAVIPTDVSLFGGNITQSATDVMAALAQLSALGGLGGAAATVITLNTAGFSGNLSAADTNVQLAMETIDDMVAGGAPAASDVTCVTDGFGGLITTSATNVLAALNQLSAKQIPAANISAATAGFGGLITTSATDVQAALNQLSAKQIPSGNISTTTGDFGGSITTSATDVRAALKQLSVVTHKFGAYASMPPAGFAGSTYIASDAPVAQWVDDGAAWRPLVGGVFVGTVPGVASGWAWVNQGSATLADSNGALVFTGVNDTTTVTRRGCVKTYSSASGYIDAAIQFASTVETTASRYGIVGIMMYESGTGKSYNATLTKYHAELYTGFGLSTWTGDTTRATSVAYGQATNTNGLVFLRLRVNGSNVEMYYSPNGFTWILFDQQATSAVFTTAPDRYGFWAHGYNTTPKIVIPHLVIGEL